MGFNKQHQIHANGEIYFCVVIIHGPSREALLKSDWFGEDIKSILPVILPKKSDSASMDMAVELLLMTGRSLPEVMMMLIPEAWEKRRNVTDQKSILRI